MSDAKANGKALTGNGRKAFRYYGKKAEDKSEGIPILKYGKGNNFYKFKTAVSTQAMKEYGNLGKLINLEAYYVPVFDPPDLTNQGLTAAQLVGFRTGLTCYQSIQSSPNQSRHQSSPKPGLVD